MQPIRVIIEDAPENIHIPESLQHQRIEVVFRQLNKEVMPMGMESAFGILQAPHSVSLEQMDAAIEKQGGKM